MGLQEEFDQLYTFTAAIEAPLGLVEDGWRSVIAAEAVILATVGEADWQDRLAGISYAYADTHKPAGLSAEAEAAWYERCANVREKALRMIQYGAQRIVSEASSKLGHVATANALLQSARAAYLAGDTWAPGWVLELVLGVWHGQEAGGSDAFAAGADRTLFNTARAFLIDNRRRALEIFDAARESWPSDAEGLSEYRMARAALAALVGA